MSRAKFPTGGGFDKVLATQRSSSVDPLIRRIPMETGNVRQRRLGRAFRRRTSFQFKLTINEHRALMGFVDYVGAEWFLFEIADIDTPSSGIHTVRLTGAVSAESIGAKVLVSIPLEFSTVGRSAYTEPGSGPQVAPGTIQ